MKIQYASDLHLEMPGNRNFIKKYPLIPVADTLVLAGDIIHLKPSHLKDQFFDDLSRDFKHVYLIPGNHEFYYEHHDISTALHDFRFLVRENVQYINNVTIYPQERVRIIFTTLWTKISEGNKGKVVERIRDFGVSKFDNREFEANVYNNCHEICLKFLLSELNKPFDGTTTVVSHHVPYPQKFGVWLGDTEEVYYVDLTNMMKDYKIDHWIHGHNHWIPQTFQIHDTKIHSNQLGYVYRGHNEDFRRDAIIEV
jgi:3',5'-cyclic AMP phosphodiesterase CpdA